MQDKEKDEVWMEKREGMAIKQGIYSKFLKRVLDVVISLIGLVVFSPVWLVVIILVKVNLGSPVFFTQVRAGKKEKPFKMIKFRTMKDLRDEQGNLLPDTERFSKFGDFLRNSSIDEIPELFNVLKGDMSLIGPRPLYVFYLPFYTEEESLRHSVRGGITGLAQINGRNVSDWETRLRYDVEYVQHVTLVNDVKIFFKTIAKVLAKEDVGIPSVSEPDGLHLIRTVQRPDVMAELQKSDDKNIPQFIRHSTILNDEKDGQDI